MVPWERCFVKNLAVKSISAIFILTAQPLSVHYSSNGNYLVDQNGQKAVIQGHPHMTCYRPHGELQGTFDKARGSTIWLKVPTIPAGGPLWYVEIKNPVCDLK